MVKRIIRDIIVRKKEKIILKKEEIFQPEKIKKKRKSLVKIVFLVLAFCLIVFLSVKILSKFSSVEVKVGLRYELKNINLENSLGFEVVRLEHEESVAAKATGISAAGWKASGLIVIYNTYSSHSQKLSKETRFEAPNGKIYKIKGPVVVPGNGSVEAIVYAEKTGPEYNIGLVDFTIPGFKGTAKYEKIYARSKIEIKGGASRTVSFITADDLEQAKNKTNKDIEKYLKETINKQKPADYLIYDGALKFIFSDDSSNLKFGEVAEDFVFKQKGEVVGFLLKKDDLSKILVEKYIQNTDNSDIYVDNLEELEFTLFNENSDGNRLNFRLNGDARFVWKINTESLVADLMSVKKGKYEDVFAKYQNIKKAEIFFKPSWWRLVPKDSSRIKVESTIFKDI